MKEYNLVEVCNETDPKISKEQSGAIGWCRMLETAISNYKGSPILFLEDDIAINGDCLPEYIEFPEDADWIYLGISNKNVYKRRMVNDKLSARHHDDTYIQVYNMMTTHAVLVTSLKGMLALHKACLEAYFTSRIWDYYITQIQPWYNVYAMKRPLFYQDIKQGGLESFTKIEYKNDHSFEPLDKSIMNKSTVSYLTIPINSL
jgi:hypothetical protein